VLGRPASASTLYRTLDGIGPVQLAKLASARAKVRSRVHDLLDLRPGGFPWIRVDRRPLTGWTVLDIDASFVPAHSEKGGAEPHRKGFGLHPLLMFCDNTDEPLVCRLRPGSAWANTASDHIEVSREAVRQMPTRRRRKEPPPPTHRKEETRSTLGPWKLTPTASSGNPSSTASSTSTATLPDRTASPQLTGLNRISERHRELHHQPAPTLTTRHQNRLLDHQLRKSCQSPNPDTPDRSCEALTAILHLGSEIGDRDLGG
jgi:hypothetical protein